MGIELDSEMEHYENVPYKLSKKLFERRSDYDPRNPKNEELIKELHEKGKLYNKIRHGKKIAMKMVEMDEVPEDVKSIICKIVEKFNI